MSMWLIVSAAEVAPWVKEVAKLQHKASQKRQGFGILSGPFARSRPEKTAERTYEAQLSTCNGARNSRIELLRPAKQLAREEGFKRRFGWETKKGKARKCTPPPVAWCPCCENMLTECFAARRSCNARGSATTTHGT